MKKISQLIAILVLLFPATLLAQVKKHFSLAGNIKNKAIDETLPGAKVSILEHPSIGISANTYGYYLLSAPAGSCTVITCYTGFVTDTLHIDLKSNLLHNFGLQSSAKKLAEVKIKSSCSRSNNILTSHILSLEFSDTGTR